MPRRVHGWRGGADGDGVSLLVRGPRSSKARLLLMLAAPMVVAGMFFSVSPRAEDAGVAGARDRWEDVGAADYSMTYTFRGLGPATVRMTDGVMVDYRTDDPRLEDGVIYWPDRLFEVLAEVEADPAGEVVSVDYDDELGVPVRATVDPDTSVPGDEWSFEVLDLVLHDS